MPTHTSLLALGNRLLALGNRIFFREVSAAVADVSEEVDRALVTTTPVDTGRARSNWIVTTGSPATGEIVETNPEDASYDRTGGEALAQARAVLEKYAVEQGPVHITNNVPYIGRLDRGHSRQAPNGMTADAVLIGLRAAKRARIRLEGR